MRTVKKLLINHLLIVIIFSDSCCGIKNINVDTNNLVDVTSRQLSSYQQPISFFPRDDEDNSDKYISHESQRQQYSPQYSQNVPIIDYNYNEQPQYESKPNKATDSFRFSNEQREGNYFMNQNEVIPQRQESYFANHQTESVIPLSVRPLAHYRPQIQKQTYSNYYKKYRRIPPVYNNYYNQNPGKYEQYIEPHQNYPQQNYYQPSFQNNENYAGQYDNYFDGAPNQPPNLQNYEYPYQFNGGPFGSGVGQISQNPNQFNGGPFGGNVGNQLTKAIEDISSNDDYQCVPKLICQMVGNPSRPNNLPSFLSGPALTTLIAALPSNSPFLNFGRAALLGISGGERSCDSTYPKCPRNEDDLLYYLNNHRGGFFRFFNGGASFGDDAGSIYHNYQNQNNQNYQTQNNQNHKPQDLQSTFTNLATLQNLAGLFNQNGGINLSNLGANAGLLSSLASLTGYQNKNKDDVGKYPQSAGNGVGDFVSNLLTGLVGNRLAARRISKRSLDTQIYDDNDINDTNKIKRGISRKRNLDLEVINPYESFETKKFKYPHSESKVIQRLLNFDQLSNEISPDLTPVAQRRILNIDQPQIPVVFESSNKIESQNEFFPKEQQYIFQFVETNRVPKKFFPEDLTFKLPDTSVAHGLNAISYQNIHKFPNENSIPDDHRGIRGFKFVDDHLPYIPRPLDYYDTSKMIFPDRTGTGNLRFDNDAFHSTRFGKILNRQPTTYTQSPTNTNQNQYQYYHQFSYPSSSTSDSFSTSTSSSSRPNYYTYSSTATRDGPQTSNDDRNVYVTNGNGVVEYYINERGEKIYT